MLTSLWQKACMAKAFWCENVFIDRIHVHVSRGSNFVKLKLLTGFTGVVLLCIKFLSIFCTIDKLEKIWYQRSSLKGKQVLS